MPTKIIKNDEFTSKWIYKKSQDIARRQAVCNDREHNPPSHIVLHPGDTMVHTCPTCNKITIVNNRITYHL